MITFSLLAFFKTRTFAASRQVSHVRLSRDRQLTTMTLFHVLSAVVSTIPFAAFNVYSLSANAIEAEEIVRSRLISTATILLLYEGFAVSCTFYQ